MPKKGKIKRNTTNPLNLNNRENLENTLKKKWVVAAIEMMQEGLSTSYIREKIANEKQGSVTVNIIDSIMAEANSIICNDQFTKSEEVRSIHIKRYNKRIKQLLETEELDEDDIYNEDLAVDDEGNLTAGEGGYSYKAWLAARNRKIRAYDEAMNTMRQKEELMQFHQKGFEVVINTEENVTVVETKPKYDLSKLSFEERKEMLELILKAKKGENNMISVIESAEETKVEDVEHEVVQETPNIEQIKKLELVDMTSKSQVVADPAAKLKETLKKLAAKKIQEAGGNLNEEERNLLK